MELFWGFFIEDSESISDIFRQLKMTILVGSEHVSIPGGLI